MAVKTIIVEKDNRKLTGEITLPASKSISNRLMIIHALCGGDFMIRNLSRSDDTWLMIKALEMIRHPKRDGKVQEIDVNNAGTVLRFLTAYLSIHPGKWMVTGSERMKQRPVGILADALNTLGASIDYLGKPGYPPLLISGRQLTGDTVSVNPGVSSQFVSALLLIAPYLKNGLKIRLHGKWVSTPYVTMTIRLMEQCGARIKTGSRTIRVYAGKYNPPLITVEADWSAAAFWYEAAALADEVNITLNGLIADSLQGDAIVPDLFRNFGVMTEFIPDGVRLTKVPTRTDGFFYDFTDHPDLAQAIIATCAGLGIRGRFEGLKSLRIKETDRLRALIHELEKSGAPIRAVTPQTLSHAIDLDSHRLPLKPGICFETYSDHRMAMALAPLALKMSSLKVRNPDVVIKSYPDFWDHMRQFGFNLI